jgi:signal peptidase II
MHPTISIATLFIALVLFVGCDQLAKTIARDEFASAPPHSYFNGALRLEYTENPGSFMSIGADLPEGVRLILYEGATLVVITGIVLIMLHIHRLNRRMLIGFTLLLAGACGNLLDRFFNHGRVIDFIMIDIGRAHTGVFNVADVLITAGAAILLFSTRERKGHAS